MIQILHGVRVCLIKRDRRLRIHRKLVLVHLIEVTIVFGVYRMPKSLKKVIWNGFYQQLL